MNSWCWMAVVWFGGSLICAQQAEQPQVLFSGHPQASRPSPATPASALITGAERRAVEIVAWDLDVHLEPSQQSIEAHARVTLRNDGAMPLATIPLQLSSTLRFEVVGLDGKPLPFSQSILPSDADHTGELREAAVTLPQLFAPQGEVTLTVDYGGTIPVSAERVTALGAPAAAAAASDWDRISTDFTGLRGFGDVVWYPVSSVPAALGDGDRLFVEIGRQKLMDQDATMALRVTDEFTGEPPNVALLNGHWVPLSKPAVMPTTAYPGVITCSLPAMRLGFEAPSLFLARRTETGGDGVRVLATSADEPSAQAYIAAATRVEPLVQRWLGNQPHPKFTVLDLPEADDAPAETGNVLAIPLGSGDARQLAPIVAHGLAHAAFWSPRAWLNEGVANFVGALWIEAAEGRTAALENLNTGRTALALAEPAEPGDGQGRDLLHAESAVYYRTKATYVLWMLRSLAGDDALQSALQAYRPALDTTPDYFEHLIEGASHRDLRWFFSNWVYHDDGLPDLSVAGVYFSPEAHNTSLVAVDIVNNGYAEAEVPVTIRGADTSDTVEVRVPAHGSITHRVIFQEPPTEVDVNDGSVPEVEASVHVKTVKEVPPGGFQ
ncbi:MAG TPA: hypothetical protein VME18_08290 [Acidobacteriaceae bacterium]|nr:hypothetical protein [Acidobacteriaceae bacterium]